MKAAAAHAIFHVLRDWDVDAVFTCPGSTEAAFLDVCAEYPDIRVILTTHESIAVSAADGLARMTGRPAVAYLHANVGLANGIAHLYAAQLAQSPVVILNGIKSTEIAGRGAFTTAPHMRDYVRQHVRYDAISLSAQAVAEDLTRALKAATAEPGGPVYVGLHQDIIESEAEVVIPQRARHAVDAIRRPSREAIDRAAQQLAAARALTIVAGSEVEHAGALHLLVTLAERLGAAVVIEDRRTIERLGFPTDHAQFAGTYSAQSQADVMFFCGVRSLVEFEPPRGPSVPSQATIVHLASDPVEIGKVDPVDVPLTGNVRATLSELLTALATIPLDDEGAVARRAFARDERARYRTNTDRDRESARSARSHVPISPIALMQALADALPQDAIVVGDPVTSGGYLLSYVIADSKRRYFTTSSGSLGWGMGAAIGIALAEPEKQVVAVVGDGVFQFGIQALWTAVSLALPLTIVVVDNAAYAAVRAALKRYRAGAPGDYPATSLDGIDIAAVARGFGANALRIEHLDELPPALLSARATRGPTVIVVRTDPAHTGP